MKRQNSIPISRKTSWLTLLPLALAAAVLPAQSPAQSTERAALVEHSNIKFSAAEGEKKRLLVDPPLGTSDKLLQHGFELSASLKIGTDRSGKVLGIYGLDFIFSPGGIAKNIETRAFNPNHLIYLDQKANGQWEIYHAGKKLAGESAAENTSFLRDLTNEIKLIANVIEPARKRATIQYFVNGTLRGKTEIDWGKAESSLGLAIENRNARSEISSLKLTALGD
jgi:hypothetical protein